MSPEPNRVVATIGSREVPLSNLDKALYPNGFTKAELLDYYARVGPVMLEHLKGRPVTVKRFPNGTDTSGFIEKNVPRHAPDWIRTVTLPRRPRGGRAGAGSDGATTRFVVVDELATLIWLVNLAAIEFHTPQWRVGRRGEPTSPDLVVFDLDPGAPATIAECCTVALRLRERVAEDGIELVAKTSGSKGLQCYGSISSRRWPPGQPSEYARSVAEALRDADPSLVVSVMTKAARPGKVFIDWSQNNPSKTTVSPYSLRGLSRPTVSTPLTWGEVELGAEGEGDLLELTPADVLGRIERLGDLFGSLS